MKVLANEGVSIVVPADSVVLLDAGAVSENDWLDKIIPSLDAPAITAAGGYAVTANTWRHQT